MTAHRGKVKRERICLGYPKGHICTNVAGTPWTPYWCLSCDEQRRAKIGAFLNAELAYREGRGPKPT